MEHFQIIPTSLIKLTKTEAKRRNNKTRINSSVPGGALTPEVRREQRDLQVTRPRRRLSIRVPSHVKAGRVTLERPTFPRESPSVTLTFQLDLLAPGRCHATLLHPKQIGNFLVMFLLTTPSTASSYFFLANKKIIVIGQIFLVHVRVVTGQKKSY